MENNNTLVENDIPLGAKYNRNLKNTEKRILWVDYLKAFACLLVVLGHLLQSFQRANIDFNLELTTFINWFIYLFHMPVFMCMSGYLYCKKRKEFSWNNYKKFELKKIINLLIPYFTFYLITIGLNMLFSGSVNNKMGIQELKNIINNPISPYWFLYALLSIYIVIPILEKSLKNNKNAVFIVLIVLKVISIFINTNIYFLDSIMEYSIYFYLGNYIVDTNKLISTKKVIINLALIITYLILSIIFYVLRNSINMYLSNFIGIFFAIAGIYVCVNVFRGINKLILLDTFKKYTFQIYLMHTIFAAGARIMLLKIGITNYSIHLIIGLLVSIYIPVIVSIFSKKIKYTEIFFYPIKTITELKERN